MLDVKRNVKIMVGFLLCLIMVLGSLGTIYACTAIYVGKDVSADGTFLVARSNDEQSVWGNHVTITERVTGEPGRVMPVDNDATVFAELPETTYRYTSTPFLDSVVAVAEYQKDAAICANEYGVVMTMSITAFSNKAALKADPLVEHGLTENTAVDLVICQSDSARKAVEVLTSLIDQYGSSEVNIALIADQNEAWYVDMYTGHQYAAVRLPDDKVCVFGNEFTLDYLSNYEDRIVSPDLESLAAENGFAVYGENQNHEQELNLCETYAGDEVLFDYNHMRTWIGHKILAPEEYGDYDKHADYPLCFTPSEAVSLQDVMELIRNRYEGTEYSPDETGRTDMRVIGTDTAMSVHIAQVYPQLPTSMSCVTWESSGPAIYGVFVPVSNAALSISEAYGRNQSAEEAYRFDTEHFPYYRFKELTTLSVEADAYKIYGEPVRAYWHQAETGMIKGMSEVLKHAADMSDPQAAAQYITDYCNRMQDQAFSDAGELLNDVRWCKSKNSCTLKNGINPETEEILDELEPVDPLTVKLDASVYQEVPGMAAEE